MGLLDKLIRQAGRYLKKLANEAAQEAQDPALERLNARRRALVTEETRLRKGRDLSMSLSCLSGSGLLAAGLIAFLVEGHWLLTGLLVGFVGLSLWQAIQAASVTRSLVVVLSQKKTVVREIEERREAHRNLLEDKTADRLKERIDKLVDFVLDEEARTQEAVRDLSRDRLLSIADEEVPPMLQERARLRQFLLRTDRASLDAEIDGATRRLAEAEAELDIKKSKVLDNRLNALEGKMRELDRLHKRLESLDDELAALDATLEHLELKLLVEQCADWTLVKPLMEGLDACLKARALPPSPSGPPLLEASPSQE